MRVVEKLRIAAGIMGEAAEARGARRIAAGRAARRTVAIEDIFEGIIERRVGGKEKTGGGQLAVRPRQGKRREKVKLSAAKL